MNLRKANQVLRDAADIVAFKSVDKRRAVLADIDAVGKWAAGQKNSKQLSAILHQAHHAYLRLAHPYCLVSARA